jgi:hypothetical protein
MTKGEIQILVGEAYEGEGITDPWQASHTQILKAAQAIRKDLDARNAADDDFLEASDLLVDMTFRDRRWPASVRMAYIDELCRALGVTAQLVTSNQAGISHWQLARRRPPSFKAFIH